MSLQLKEPCIRSLRHVGVKPPLLNIRSKSVNIQDIKKTSINYESMLKICKTFEDTRILGKRPTTSMYLDAITAYGYTKNKDKLIDTWEDYRRNYLLKSSSHQRYIKALIECGDMTAASKNFLDLKTKHFVKPKDIAECLVELVPACLEKNNIYLALQATNDYLNHANPWDEAALQSVTHSLWNKFSTILHLDNDITPTTIDTFIRLYIDNINPSRRDKGKNHFSPQHLFTMFRLITVKNETPSAYACNLVLEAQLPDANYRAIKWVVAFMQKHHIQPTAHTISILLSAFGSFLPSKNVQFLYSSLKQNNRIDENIFQAFIKVFSEKQDMENAQAVLSDMKSEGLQLGQKPCIAIVEGFVNKDCLGQADDWLKQNEDSAQKSLDAYAVLMEAWISKGNWTECISKFAWLERKKIEGVHTNRRIIKAMLTAKFASGKCWDQCEGHLNNLSISFTPNTISRILRVMLGIEQNGHYLIPGKNIIRALQMMEQKLDVHLNSEGISRIITALGERGDISDAFALYNWVRKDNTCTRTRCSGSNIYRAMMHSAILNNDLRKLERAWVDMQYRKWFLDCESGTRSEKLQHTLARYNMLLNGYASKLPHPDITRLKKTFQRMLKHGLTPNIFTYNILIKAFAYANNMDAANQVYHNMIDAGITPDTTTANTLLNGWILQEDWKAVERFVQKLKSADDNKQQPRSGLDMVTFNLLVQSFLHLDSKSMAYEKLLKRENKWYDVEQLENSRTKLKSGKIWNIFEMTTGYKKETIDNYYKSKRISEKADSSKLIVLPSDFGSIGDFLIKAATDQQSVKLSNPKDAFIRFFSRSMEPDEVTYKLFMKAFYDKGDYHSASKIKEWTQFRLGCLKK
ncbi:hypothetical protein RMATCC62417_05830 [Rhizopus microsporus]|nr:hypothetical protein RMATCC62417_05830 [Rhizopus microsporus]